MKTAKRGTVDTGVRRVAPLAMSWLVLVSAGCLDTASEGGGGLRIGFDRCAGVVCTPEDSCHTAGVCDPVTGRCSTPVKDCPSGQACDVTDGQCKFSCATVVCYASDACHLAGACDTGSGECTPEQPLSCPAGQTCDVADGTCKSGCGGVVCTASDLCHLAGTCSSDTGECSPETLKSCPSGQSCDPADGACKDPCTGVVCTPTDLCHVVGSCNSSTGQCPAQTPVPCPSGQSCDPADGVCKDLCATVVCPPGETCNPNDGQCQASFTVPRPQTARNLELATLPVGLAMDTAGNTYVAGAIFSTTPVDFDGHLVHSNGDNDVFIARYDTTGHAVWAEGFGDAASSQLASRAAVTQDGTVALLGRFTGSLNIGNAISAGAELDFVAAVQAASGAGKFARSFDTNNGTLLSLAANPSSSTNRIAFCGKAAGLSADFAQAGFSYTGGNDIVIAVFNSAGTKLWSLQIGASGNEECDAIAIDDAGDVYASGNFDSATLTIPGTPALTGPGTTSRKFLWVAKLNGASGAGISSAAFSGAGGQIFPRSVSVDATGKLVVGGNFSGNPTFGGTTVTSSGGQDVFVTRLDLLSSFTPAWAVRLGGPAADVAAGVATTSSGDVVVTGFFNGTTDGAAVLTAARTTGSDVFLLKLDGVTGSTQFAAGYGDALIQSGDSLAVNRFGADQFSAGGTLNGTITFPAPAGAATAASGATETFLVVGNLQ